MVIDLRAGDPTQRAQSREALRVGLAGVSGIRVLTRPQMDAALRGERDDPNARRGKQALAAAALAYGRLDCVAARRAARAAAIEYAALQARTAARTAAKQTIPAGTDRAAVHDALRRAYVYTLLCAHGSGDQTAAQTAADRLRDLGVTTAPTGVSPEVWKRYPPAGAAPMPIPGGVPVPAPTMAELHVSGPVGATVWVDHRPRGNAPVFVKLPPGVHVVAAATVGGAAAQLTKLGSGRTSIAMTIQTADPKWTAVATTIASWKAAGRILSTTDFAQLLRSLGVRFAFVMTGREVEVWGLQKYRKTARRLGAKPARQPVQLAALVTEHASAWDGRSPDPSLPLLTEGNTKKSGKKPHKWWVYASIIGAVLVGGAIIIGQDAADNTQRIRLTFP